MGDKSAIEWTDATWNPVRGCVKVSPGCKHCYAETFAERFRGVKGHPYEQGFDLRLVPDKLDQPLRWKRPRRIFVNSMSDLFQEGVPDSYIGAVFAVMALASQHTFQVLTKRADRACAWMAEATKRLPHRWWMDEALGRYGFDEKQRAPLVPERDWPLPNVWLGVSVENQEYAEERIPHLLQTPAAVRFVSAEPLLGPIEFIEGFEDGQPEGLRIDWLRGADLGDTKIPALNWIICGGESGPGARPMYPQWARGIRDQCIAAGVPFFFKQWGEWCADDQVQIDDYGGCEWKVAAEVILDMPSLHRVGKKVTGRLLDGREWNEFPKDERRV